MSQTTHQRLELLDPATLADVVELVKRAASDRTRYDPAQAHRLRAVAEFLLMPAREAVRQFEERGLLVEPPELVRARRKAAAKLAMGELRSANAQATAYQLAGGLAAVAGDDSHTDRPE